ncbi:MAG: hypothetical protein E6H00_12870 [Bacillati bacterium ANGP1]|uniref:J domain-containing protein n=1 Tax=Candidatus Segetimicrobium genomatis TaxID=2569760 RepID=A0A537JXQ3_9BACT|nr:MAG: hypothetical protein E6H00_12870 [Terrabacteria group bacterium ANGP1]
MPKKIRIRRQTYKRKNPADFVRVDFGVVVTNLLVDLALNLARAFIPDFDAFFRQQMREQRNPVAWRKTLGLENENPTRRRVLERFRELARQHHPDHGGDHRKFVALVAARDAALAELSA